MTTAGMTESLAALLRRYWEQTLGGNAERQNEEPAKRKQAPVKKNDSTAA